VPTAVLAPNGGDAGHKKISKKISKNLPKTSIAGEIFGNLPRRRLEQTVHASTTMWRSEYPPPTSTNRPN
jgi:hypothetical protein